ncbi:PTS fructose transporter subunit IIB, partial [Lactobacillus delbrueckii]
DLGFTPAIPVINAGPILYRMPAMAKPVYDKIEGVIKKENLK